MRSGAFRVGGHTMTHLDTTASASSPSVDAKPPAPRFSKPTIILVRHGKPALDRTRAISFAAYRDWWKAYDDGGLHPDQPDHQKTLAIAPTAEVIYASTLRRAQETANALFPARERTNDPNFVEAPLPPPMLFGLRLRPGVWGVLARISWWLGFSGPLENRTSVDQRVDIAADTLIAAAHKDGGKIVFACAHGWFNRMMRPALHARGWHCVEDGGDGYWSYRRFVPLV